MKVLSRISSDLDKLAAPKKQLSGYSGARLCPKLVESDKHAP